MIVPDGAVSLLELVCVAGVVAEREDVVNVAADDVCEEVGCELKLLSSVDLCGMLADEGAAKFEDKMVVDDSTGCNVEVAEALADNRVVDVITEKTAEVAKEVADVIIFEEAIVEIAAEVMEESGVEVATDGTVEVVDGMTGGEETTRTVDEVKFAKDDVGTALVEKATPEDVDRTVDKIAVVEDVVGTALEERLWALMMSAAFSATPYTTACKCAAGITGKIPASTTLKFCVPQTRRCESTTPPCSSGSIANVPLGWNSVRIPLLIT